MSYNSIQLNRSDVEELLELIGAVESNEGFDGIIKLTSDNSSGIGAIVEAEVKVSYNGLPGVFRKTITNESSW